MIITIDGPSGSGKTTLALNIAKHLNFFCLNSGYLYRGLAYVLKTFYAYDFEKMKNPDINDINTIFQSGKFQYHYNYGLIKIYWANEDITSYLKDPEISKYSALIGQNEYSRNAIHDYERFILDGKDVVVEGRSCGSFTYSHADIKFFIDASIEIRADRLQIDQKKRGKILSKEEALKQIQWRDLMDKERLVEPLVIPAGAIILDSSFYNIEELFQQALNAIKEIIKK